MKRTQEIEMYEQEDEEFKKRGKEKMEIKKMKTKKISKWTDEPEK